MACDVSPVAISKGWSFSLNLWIFLKMVSTNARRWAAVRTEIVHSSGWMQQHLSKLTQTISTILPEQTFNQLKLCGFLCGLQIFVLYSLYTWIEMKHNKILSVKQMVYNRKYSILRGSINQQRPALAGVHSALDRVKVVEKEVELKM